MTRTLTLAAVAFVSFFATTATAEAKTTWQDIAVDDTEFDEPMAQDAFGDLEDVLESLGKGVDGLQAEIEWTPALSKELDAMILDAELALRAATYVADGGRILLEQEGIHKSDPSTYEKFETHSLDLEADLDDIVVSLDTLSTLLEEEEQMQCKTVQAELQLLGELVLDADDRAGVLGLIEPVVHR